MDNPNLTPSSPLPATTPAKSSSVLVTILGFLTLALLATSVFLFLQNQKLRQQLSPSASISTPTPTEITPTASPSATPISTMSAAPIVHTPKADSTVKSPLKVTGSVPKGWMFEGTFPIKLTTLSGDLIAQSIASETKPGSWQTEDPVNFTATLTFTTSATSGYLELDKDNPSGLPENNVYFRLPIRFK